MNAYDKTVIYKQKKRKHGNQIFLHKTSPELRPDCQRERYDIIYRRPIWRISLPYGWA